ncbi:MAG TPA: hypothetical protein PK129_00770 [Cellvibrionaceae bacterium]|nr:hypothetical protein [Cellvibrionaceae bacterium]
MASIDLNMEGFMKRYCSARVVLASSIVVSVLGCNGALQPNKVSANLGASSSSSSSSSSGASDLVTINDDITGASVNNIDSYFSYESRAYTTESVTVFSDNVCPSSTGRLQADAQGYAGVGYFDFDDEVGSRLDFPSAGNQGGPVGYSGIQIHYSNGTSTQLPMEVWISGKRVAENLNFPPTGGWSVWRALSIGLNGDRYTSHVQLSLVAKTALGGPHIDTMQVGFWFKDCFKSIGCGNSSLPPSYCP